jgi:hypothetical protein
MANKKATTTTKRTCSICQKPGHNQRTCPDKKEETAEAVPPARSSSVALATVERSEPSSAGVTHPSHAPLEFEENTKQVHVHGTSMKLTVREYEQGSPTYIFHHHRSGTPQPVEIPLNGEELLKIHELSGWGLQRTAVSGGTALPPKTHVNGQAARVEGR